VCLGGWLVSHPRGSSGANLDADQALLNRGHSSALARLRSVQQTGCMTALRSRRLEALFAKSLDDLSAADIESLVTNGVSEAFDIDFKDSLYGSSDTEKRDLAGDVAALANTAGGILILGVDEDEHSVAKSADGVQIGDAEIQRIRQITASLIAPLPTFDIISIATAGDPMLGYLVIAVPRSVAAPHAVLVKNALRYPKRNGSTTRYLSEAEVAAAYLDRLRRADRLDAKVESVNEDARSRLDDSKAWVTVTMVPDLAGAMDIDQKTFKAFSAEIIGSGISEITGRQVASFQKTSVGRKRFIAFESNSPYDRDSWASAQFYEDGSGSYSLQIHDISPFEAGGKLIGTNRILSEESVIDAILTGIQRLADHARNRAAAGGDALISVTIRPPILGLSLTLALGHQRRGTAVASGVANSRGLDPVEVVASLDDIAQPGPDLVAVVARAVNLIAQNFGIPELGQLTLDGQLRRRYWAIHWQSPVAAWALPAGVAVIEDDLE
jgi:hypothetical protein